MTAREEYLPNAESYLMVTVNKLRGLTREPWLMLGICILAFSLSAGMRLLEFPRWDPTITMVDGEYLLTTHDAYFWVAGAEGANQYSADMPMAVTLNLLAGIIPLSSANLAFWAPAFMAALAAVPIVLWAFKLNAPYAALAAAVLGSLAPAFYTRTRLGYYDTDWATLFFPLIISWLLTVWIQPRLREPADAEADKSAAPFDLQNSTIIVLVVAVSLPWHNFVALYLTSLLWIAAAFVVFFGREGTRVSSFQVLLAIAITVGLGWWGAILGLILMGVQSRSPGSLRHPWTRRITMVVLLLMLMYLTWIQFEGYFSSTFTKYAAWLMQEPAPSGAIYPDLIASVRETQYTTVAGTLEGIGFVKVVGLLGIVGYGLLLWKKPITLFLLPLLLLGLTSIRLGARFTMFAAPLAFLGLLVPVDWSLAYLSQKHGWESKIRGLITVSGLILALVWVYRYYARLPIEPVVRKGHAETLLALGEIAHPESIVWTWWDYGYATQHFTGLHTFADGGRNSGEYLFTTGLVLGAGNPTQSAQLMRFAAQHDFQPWQTWDNWEDGVLGVWLAGLSEEPITAKADMVQYLVLPWEAVSLMPWIQYYGSWDFHTSQGQRSTVSQVLRPLELDLESGKFTIQGGESLYVETADILEETGVVHYDYPRNHGGPHLILNTVPNELLLLDDRSYYSVLVQHTILSLDQLEGISPFRLVIDNVPAAKVFQLE